MPNAMRSIVFATVMCVVCSLLLTAASTGLKSYQQKNIEVDRQKNILKAFGIVSEDQKIGAAQIQSEYAQYVKSFWVDDTGRVLREDQRGPRDLPIYLYVKDEMVQAYVLPIDTRGLWGEIHGYLALDNDGTTIRGFTVYKHQETPGLGGEIESRWFRKNFEGKKILDSQGEFASVHIAKGNAADAMPPDKRINYVDGISGATMTGKFLSEGLKEILKEYEPVAIQFRQKNKRYLRVQ